MKQSAKRLSSLLLSLLFLVAAFMVLFDLIQPTYGNLQELKGKQVSDENYLASETNLVAQAKKLIGEYQNESQAQSTLALAMPSGPSIASAVAQIYGIAQNNGIAVRSIGISAPTVQLQSTARSGSAASSTALLKPIGSYSLQITAGGSYEGLKNFLSEVETNIRIFDLTALSLNSTAAVPSLGSKTATPATPDFFTYDLTFKTYYQAQ